MRKPVLAQDFFATGASTARREDTRSSPALKRPSAVDDEAGLGSVAPTGIEGHQGAQSPAMLGAVARPVDHSPDGISTGLKHSAETGRPGCGSLVL